MSVYDALKSAESVIETQQKLIESYKKSEKSYEDMIKIFESMVVQLKQTITKKDEIIETIVSLLGAMTEPNADHMFRMQVYARVMLILGKN